jgi:hypothetical protein
MKAYKGAVLGSIFAVLALLLAPVMVRAEVTRVEISSKQDVLGGKAFGTVGAYEKLTGKVYFAIDPNNAHNKIIADLDKAPKNAQGKVDFHFAAERSLARKRGAALRYSESWKQGRAGRVQSHQRVG